MSTQTPLVRLASRVASWARSEPSREALAEGARRLTYGELWSEVRALAGALSARGLAPGDRVAVILPNCLEAAVAIYAIWHAGGVLVPLNAQARARDFGRWLALSEARFVIHAQGNRDVDEAMHGFANPPQRVVVTASKAIAFSHRTASGEETPVGPSAPLAEADQPADRSLATILFTSGTTGRPKGVMLSHENHAANVDSIVEYLALSASDSIVTVLPFYYSYGASVLHTHLTVGARLVIEPNLVFPVRVVEALARERVSGFSGVPSTFALLLDRVQLGKHDLSSLRYVTQAGGGMAPALAERLRAALPHTRLFIMYGQTEATARLTYLPPERFEEKLGSVGVPVPGVEIEVRRDDGSPAAPREVGEVWARGRNVMLGFLGDPEGTASVLRDGWLRTGDMGHLDEDGVLYLRGRRSDMIKTGAHRLHPSEIEETIAEIPGVIEVAVVGVDDDILGQTVKAFVVASDGVRPESIKAYCHEHLAAYKVPKSVELVASLPKTASGKIQRAALGQPPATEAP